MPYSIRVDWTQDHEFLRLVRNRTARKTRLYRGTDDLLEPLSVVWTGLNEEFKDGQYLKGNEIGRMLKILDRKVSGYFRSRGAKPIKQPTLPQFEQVEIENVKAYLDPPHQSAIQKEQIQLIEAELSKLPPHISEAVRSRYGFTGAQEWSEFVRASGTSRQNVSKLVKKALKQLKLVLPDSIRE